MTGCRLAVEVAIAAALAASVISNAHAASEPAYADVARHLAVNHVLPRYRALRTAAIGFEASAQKACALTGARRPGALMAPYHALVDVWMTVQHVNFGPAKLFLRATKIDGWPATRGRVAKAVRLFAARPAKTAPIAVHLGRASIAVQGLPALEFLIFHPAVGLSTDQRCRLARAMAANLVALTSGIDNDWRGGKVDYLRVLTNPGPKNVWYATHRFAAGAFYQALHDGLQSLSDLRLRLPLGKSIAKAQPFRAEALISGRSRRNISLSLKALEHLYTGGDGNGLAALVPTSRKGRALDALMRRAFTLTRQTADRSTMPVDKGVKDPVERKTLEKLLLQLTALRQIVRERLGPAIGIQVGFNNLDGD